MTGYQGPHLSSRATPNIITNNVINSMMEAESDSKSTMFSQEDALTLHGKSLNPECVIGNESDADTDDGSIFEEFEDLPKKILAPQICQ